MPKQLEDGTEPQGTSETPQCQYDKREVDAISEKDLVNARFKDLEIRIGQLVERLNELSK